MTKRKNKKDAYLEKSCYSMVDTMEQFCEKVGIEAIGDLACKENGLRIGFVVKIDGQYYTGDIDCWYLGKTYASFVKIEEVFNLNDYQKVVDCPIKIDAWDTEIDDEGPIFRYAFKENQTEEILEALRLTGDFDVWIGDSEKKSKEEALAFLDK